MKTEIKYAVFNKTESLAGSVVKDITTLAVVSLLVYVSQGSKWWTLVTGLMFIFWIMAKIAVVTKSRYKTFKTKAELQEWVDSIDCENVKGVARRDDGPNSTTAITPLPPPSCSDSSLLLMLEECCLSNSGNAADGFTIGMLKERIALLPSEWDGMYLTMQEVWNDDEQMRHLIPPDQYREKGTVCGLQLRAHGDGITKDVLGVKILKPDETRALLSPSQNASASENLA